MAKPVHRASFESLLWIGVVAFVGTACVVWGVHELGMLPSPQPDTVPAHRFSAGRAMETLEQILALGPRPLGHPSEQQTLDMVVKKLKKLRSQHLTHQDSLAMDISVQRSRTNAYMDKGRFMVYSNVSNVVARLSPRSLPAQAPAFLVSTHIDSGVRSGGAFDDGVPVACMLEVIANMLNSKPPPEWNATALVFLFNSAEEMGLLGSNAFVADHPWVSNIQAFANFEASGSAGPSILFQSSNSRLASMYAAAAPQPRGLVVAQDIFQSGVIPSGTDFKVYAEDAGIAGIDVAFYEHGDVYHTMMDNIDRVHESPGSVQQMGDNMLALVQAASRVQQWNMTDAAPGVYYDVFGMFMLSYTSEMASTMHVITLLVVLMVLTRYVYRMGTGDLVQHTVVLYGGLVFTAILSLIQAELLSNVFGPMRWFPRAEQALLLFSPAAFAGLALPVYAGHRLIPTLCLHFRGMQHAALLFHAFLLFGGTMRNVGSTYIAWLWVLGILASIGMDVLSTAAFEAVRGDDVAAATRATKNKNKNKAEDSDDPAAKMLDQLEELGVNARLIQAPLSLLPLLPLIVPLMSLDMLIALVRFFVPLMGRFGAVPADAIVAVMVSMSVCVMLVSWWPGVLATLGTPEWPMLLQALRASRAVRASRTLSRSRHNIHNGRVGVLVLRMIILMLVATIVAGLVLRPYDATHPKRIMVQSMHFRDQVCPVGSLCQEVPTEDPQEPRLVISSSDATPLDDSVAGVRAWCDSQPNNGCRMERDTSQPRAPVPSQVGRRPCRLCDKMVLRGPAVVTSDSLKDSQRLRVKVEQIVDTPSIRNVTILLQATASINVQLGIPPTWAGNYRLSGWSLHDKLAQPTIAWTLDARLVQPFFVSALTENQSWRITLMFNRIDGLSATNDPLQLRTTAIYDQDSPVDAHLHEHCATTPVVVSHTNHRIST